jgi:hypothetical protein
MSFPQCVIYGINATRARQTLLSLFLFLSICIKLKSRKFSRKSQNIFNKKWKIFLKSLFINDEY